MIMDSRKTQLQIRQAETEEDDLLFIGRLSELQSIDDLGWDRALSVVRRRMRRVLAEKAQRIANEFWNIHWMHRTGDGFETEYGGYGCRVLHREWTIYIHWYYLESIGKGRLKTTTVPAPANDVRLLKKASFPKARNWELDAIMTAEEGFGKIRRCAERLENIRLQVSGFTQLMNALKCDGDELELTPANYMEMFAPT